MLKPSKLLVLVIILLAGAIYFIGWDKIAGWFGRSHVLGENTTLTVKEEIWPSIQTVIDQNLRLPVAEDFTPLPQIVSQSVDSREEGDESTADSNFEQSLNDLVGSIKKLPERQFLMVQEQLIKEVFPDCQCSCQKENN